MELRKEYESIAQQFASSIYDCTGLGEAHDTVRNAVTACQELADRPPRELTDAELSNAYDSEYRKTGNHKNSLRAVIAADRAAQREQRVVKFRAASEKYTGCIKMFTELPNEEWEWLDADGKAQEYEVRI